MGWQRTASLMLVSAAVSVGATTAFWLWQGTEWVSPRSPVPAPPPPTDHVIVRAQGAALVVPVVGVAPAELMDTFNQARDDGERRHGAIDIMAPAGTPVVAAASGTLEKLFTSEAGGLTLYIRSADGRTITYYAHLQSYAPGLSEGQKVRSGQRLGQVGSTGNASKDGPHLHFAVNRVAPDDPWSGGRPINPFPLLTGRR